MTNAAEKPYPLGSHIIQEIIIHKYKLSKFQFVRGYPKIKAYETNKNLFHLDRFFLYFLMLRWNCAMHTCPTPILLGKKPSANSANSDCEPCLISSYFKSQPNMYFYELTALCKQISHGFFSRGNHPFILF